MKEQNREEVHSLLPDLELSDLSSFFCSSSVSDQLLLDNFDTVKDNILPCRLSSDSKSKSSSNPAFF